MRVNLENIQLIFKRMQNDGIDTEGELKWGFFFYNRNEQGLKKIYEELKDHGYFSERLEKASTNEWVLYVTKIEILSAEKLHRRNIAFNDLADYCNVDLYDGWDVEKV